MHHDVRIMISGKTYESILTYTTDIGYAVLYKHHFKGTVTAAGGHIVKWPLMCTFLEIWFIQRSGGFNVDRVRGLV